MKYRIKQEVYKDGSNKYYPQYYRNFWSGWKSLQSNGDMCLYTEDVDMRSREDAFRAIDLCEKGKNVLIEVIYEYINK